LAFPVLSPDGKLTHVDRLVNGQYVREPVHAGRGKSWKVRPLKRLPAGAIQQFKNTARDFYQKALVRRDSVEPQPVVGRDSVEPQPVNAPLPALSYEQELRLGFRLPDPDLRPDAYFMAGRTFGEQLLILCPNPAIKDAEEIAQLEKDLKWAEDKARTSEDKDHARQLRAQFVEDLAAHNLYKRYFYAENECLPLTSDTVLGLPVPADKPTGQIVADKLKSRNVALLAATCAAILLLLIATTLILVHYR